MDYFDAYMGLYLPFADYSCPYTVDIIPIIHYCDQKKL